MRELTGELLAANGHAVGAYAEHMDLLQRVRELEQRIAEMDAWSKEKDRYVLADAGMGTLVYKLKEGAEPPEPPHSICANCYAQGRKSILQPESYEVGRTKALRCLRCNTDVIISGLRHQEQPRGRR